MRTVLRFVSILLLTFGLAATQAAPSTAAGIPAVSPSTPGLVVSMAKTNGDVVVWAEEAGADPLNSDVLGAHLSDGKVFTIAGGIDNQTNPKIDGSIVIWSDLNTNCPPCDELHGRDLNGGSEFTIASPIQSLSFDDIFGDTVIWVSANQIWARNIVTMADPVLVASGEAGWGVGPIALSGDTVVWAEQTAKPDRTYPWQIKEAQIGGSGVWTIDNGTARAGAGIGLEVSGNTLVYTVGGVSDPIYGQLYAVSLDTGFSTLITEDAAFATTDGRYVIWQTHNGPDAPPELLGYDLQTSSQFRLPTPAMSNGLPDLKNGALVWTTSARSDLMVASENDVEAAYLWQVLPSGPRPDLNLTSPNWVYFPETSHYLSFGFKNFWQRSGSLPVFGYPMTEEYSELNVDLNQMMTVQYTERQRFEYHPDLSGTPYETSLGRLGAEDAARRDLLETPPFQTLSGGTTSDANCQFFAVTGHSVCFGFKDYWSTHGLDFGDPGISYRESLALFGYPISEEFTDPETGYVTQYFERAVFEYHPNNPEPYKVLLKRLGADVLEQRGW